MFLNKKEGKPFYSNRSKSPKPINRRRASSGSLAKRSFTIDTGKEKIEAEGHEHKNVAIKYLMKRRRSLLSTKDPDKVEVLFSELPGHVAIIGKQITKSYDIKWERTGTEEFAGARFTFTIAET
jgi:hypothetical protein